MADDDTKGKPPEPDMLVIGKCLMGMCAIMRTHPDLSATQHLDLGFIHGEITKFTERWTPKPPLLKDEADL